MLSIADAPGDYSRSDDRVEAALNAAKLHPLAGSASYEAHARLDHKHDDC